MILHSIEFFWQWQTSQLWLRKVNSFIAGYTTYQSSCFGLSYFGLGRFGLETFRSDYKTMQKSYVFTF